LISAANIRDMVLIYNSYHTVNNTNKNNIYRYIEGLRSVRGIDAWQIVARGCRDGSRCSRIKTNFDRERRRPMQLIDRSKRQTRMIVGREVARDST